MGKKKKKRKKLDVVVNPPVIECPRTGDTLQATFTVSGSCAANGTVTITLSCPSSPSTPISVTADANGAWSQTFTVTPPLSDVTITVSDGTDQDQVTNLNFPELLPVSINRGSGLRPAAAGELPLAGTCGAVGNHRRYVLVMVERLRPVDNDGHPVAVKIEVPNNDGEWSHTFTGLTAGRYLVRAIRVTRRRKLVWTSDRRRVT